MCNRNVSEAGSGEEVDDLCFQQSACDSTGPQVDVAQRALREDLADDDVGDLQAAAGFENARDLADGAQVDTDYAVPFRRRFLGRPLETAVPMRDGHVREASSGEDVDDLCFQQSTGDSTGPQVDVS